MKKRDARQLSSDAQENQRLSAIRAILAGTKQVDVARIFHVSVQSVCYWYPPGEPILTPGEGQGNFETFPAPAFVEISWN